MRCTDCREVLGPYVDGELLLNEQQEVREHITGCAECAREHEELVSAISTIKEELVRHNAPDVLKARIRSSLAAVDVDRKQVTPKHTRISWPRLAAAGIAIAVISSGLTLAATRSHTGNQSAERAVLDSHIRSLMPGHLTDVASTNQHNVKPWFNGRLDLSPPVPGLDSSGFVLTGGRLDYVDKRAVAVVVYMRRQHVINVYSWPARGNSDEMPHETTENGYHLVRWRTGGLELWAVSDLNLSELEGFVAAFNAASGSTPSR
ncbi:MAG: anti-sigma factor [Gemmatimonadaceae bacterium]